MTVLIPIGVGAMLALFVVTINTRFYLERAAMTPEQLREDNEEIRRFIQTW